MLGKSVLPDGLVPSVAKFGWLEIQTSFGSRPQVGLVPPVAKFLFAWLWLKKLIHRAGQARRGLVSNLGHWLADQSRVSAGQARWGRNTIRGTKTAH
jgi:hypothetical protein